jgi:glycerophosphoryl diester phosphodiesterase
MFAGLPRPTIFAHRGASAYAPENTLAAFELAVRQNAEAIELDAKLSADGAIVVIHDQTVDRTTGVSGSVRQMPLSALRLLDAGSHFDIAFRGQKIPTLEEVFETVGGKIFINVELTNYASPGDDLPDKAAALVQQFNLAGSVMFSSFNPRALRQAKKILPQVPAGLLALPGLGGAWARSRFGQWVPHQALHPELRDVTPRLVQRIHRSRRRIHVYTVNFRQDMERLFALGVDGIFTDDPLLALQVRRESSSNRQE